MKDTSKLTRKQITDRTGKRTTVWVKTGVVNPSTDKTGLSLDALGEKVHDMGFTIQVHQAMSGSKYITISNANKDNAEKFRLADHPQPSHYQVQNHIDVKSYDDILKHISKPQFAKPKHDVVNSLWDEYQKVKDIKPKILESGQAESGRMWAKTIRSPKVKILHDYLKHKIEDKGVITILQSEGVDSKSKTIYLKIAPKNEKSGVKSIDIRIGDHGGRGDIYKPDFDIRTWEDVDSAIEYLHGKYLKQNDEANKTASSLKDLKMKLLDMGLEQKNHPRTFQTYEEIKKKHPNANFIMQENDGGGAFTYSWIDKHQKRGKYMGVDAPNTLIANNVTKEYMEHLKKLAPNNQMSTSWVIEKLKKNQG